jgi:hypothetical protein
MTRSHRRANASRSRWCCRAARLAVVTLTFLAGCGPGGNARPSAEAVRLPAFRLLTWTDAVRPEPDPYSVHLWVSAGGVVHQDGLKMDPSWLDDLAADARRANGVARILLNVEMDDSLTARDLVRAMSWISDAIRPELRDSVEVAVLKVERQGLTVNAQVEYVRAADKTWLRLLLRAPDGPVVASPAAGLKVFTDSAKSIPHTMRVFSLMADAAPLVIPRWGEAATDWLEVEDLPSEASTLEAQVALIDSAGEVVRPVELSLPSARWREVPSTQPSSRPVPHAADLNGLRPERSGAAER